MKKYKLCGRNDEIKISCSEKESVAVRRAASNLIRDIYRVCMANGKLVGEEQSRYVTIIIGTIGVSRAIDQAVRERLIYVSPIQKSRQEYKWEGYVLQESGGTLYIAGADRRGTVFGIYEFCRLIGVSPWHFFADVPVKQKDCIELEENFYRADYPSVQYRGIFLNDEEELEAWAKAHTKDNTIGPETYEQIFELLLRLKGNYIWPAMHVNYFNENPENGKLADEMGIVVGTSHCDMLLRSNQNEWDPWLMKKGYEGIWYDYSLEGRNREILQEYWKESVELNRDYEVGYTVGMRGVHDYGFRTEAIDGDDSLSEEEKVRAKVTLLGQVIRDQRGILQQVLGKKDTLQTFIPYKEVLPLYDAGLDVPEDITLMWVDDNFGHMRRYPNEEEQTRSGGHGVYFHNSYWAFPGMSYLYINSIPLAHTGNELRKCYENHIRKIWVLNVGALKPLEQDIEFFLTYGWEAGKEHALTKDPRKFTEAWIDSNFSGKIGKKTAELYTRFAQITNVCKIEHLGPDTFSQTAYGDEGAIRVNQLREIYDEAANLYHNLPKEEQPAFFQLMFMKLCASYYANAEFYFADRSHLCYEQGKMAAADGYIEKSRKMMTARKCMLHYYNKIMCGGKWDNILTPEHFSPPPTAMYPAGKPALAIGEPEAGVIVWGEEQEHLPRENGSLPDILFEEDGRKVKWFELYNKGRGNFAYSIEKKGCHDWISLSEPSGVVEGEKRILVTVSDNSRPGEGELLIRTSLDDSCKTIRIKKQSSSLREEEKQGAVVESDSCLIMTAEQFQPVKSTDNGGWHIVKDMGRMTGSVIEARGKTASAPFPCAVCDFALSSSGRFNLEIYRFLTLDSVGRIRFGLSVDDTPMEIIETNTVDEWQENWKKAVMNNGEKITVRLPFLKRGRHQLHLFMIDRYVTFSKFVIYTGEKKWSNLGPDTGSDGHYQYIPDIRPTEFSGYEREVPLPEVVYAGRDFWNYERLYRRNEEYAQTELGRQKYVPDRDGKKNVLAEFGSGVFLEDQGKLGFGTEYVLEQSEYAFTTNGKTTGWSHTQSETNGGSGIAMYIREREKEWKIPEEAPSLNYKIRIQQPGLYHVWLLIKFDDDFAASCQIGLDGNPQPFREQFSKGHLYTYSTKQIWFWTLLSDIEILEGEHIFSLYGLRSGLRIDRIYLTLGGENAPMDRDWRESERENLPH